MRERKGHPSIIAARAHAPEQDVVPAHADVQAPLERVERALERAVLERGQAPAALADRVVMVRAPGHQRLVARRPLPRLHPLQQARARAAPRASGRRSRCRPACRAPRPEPRSAVRWRSTPGRPARRRPPGAPRRCARRPHAATVRRAQPSALSARIHPESISLVENDYHSHHGVDRDPVRRRDGARDLRRGPPRAADVARAADADRADGRDRRRRRAVRRPARGHRRGRRLRSA